jgi:hypothetical protein
VSGAPTGALRVGVGDDGPVLVGPVLVGPVLVGPVLVGSVVDGLDVDGSVIGAVAVVEALALTGGGDAEVVTVTLPDGVAVGGVLPPISQKASTDDARM